MVENFDASTGGGIFSLRALIDFLKNSAACVLLFIALSSQSYADNFVYIVNAHGTVTVLNAATFVPIVGSPFSCGFPLAPPGMEQVIIAISPDGSRVYVPGFQASPTTVSAFDIDPNTGALTLIGPPFAGFDTPFGVAISPDGTYVYITNFGNATVAICDPDLNILGTVGTDANPAGIAFSPSGDRVYVACTGANTVMRFDTTTSPPYLVNSFSTPSGGVSPYAVAVHPSGSYVYATNASDSVMARFDADLMNPLFEPVGITGAPNPIAIALDPDGSRIYVGTASISNIISVLDSVTLTPIVPALPSQGLNPYVPAITPDGTRLFVTNSVDSSLSVRDLIHDSYPVIAGSPFSGFFSIPYGIAFTVRQLSSPTTLTGKQKKNDFGIELELFNLLQWEAPSLGQVAGYHVYRDGVRIASLEASTLRYEDHNRKKGIETLYSLTSFDSSGNESSPISVIIQ